MNAKNLEEAQLALKVIRSVFTSAEISYEKVIVFASIVTNQSAKMVIDWRKLLRQYEELSTEIYDRKFKSKGLDFFEQTRMAIESKAYEVLLWH